MGGRGGRGRMRGLEVSDDILAYGSDGFIFCVEGNWCWGYRLTGTDVEDAVAAGRDPTGGRGANGSITRQLERDGKAEKEVLRGAV